MVTETSDYSDGSALPLDLSPATSMWHAFLLRKAAQRVTGMAEEVLQPHGLTMRHFGVLSAIEAEPGQNQRGVGERLRIDRTTVVALTDDLEGAGLLERRRGSDRRMFALYLTPAGAARLGELKDLTATVHERFLANLSDEERETLRQLLIKVLAH
ncbi:MAG TPA: MarR family transcriptional regulator [Jatrophihabitans sp.]|nr:MarR family transcriptional regulator [Jatrophihabitans sp.]